MLRDKPYISKNPQLLGQREESYNIPCSGSGQRETALTDKAFFLSERKSMKKLYEEITAHIRSRFTDTRRDYEITERSVGRGLYGVQLFSGTGSGGTEKITISFVSHES